jgi:uncharacterized iron-regulated protein
LRFLRLIAAKKVFDVLPVAAPPFVARLDLDKVRPERENRSMKKAVYGMIAVVPVLLFVLVTAAVRERLVRVSDGKAVSFDAMLRDVAQSDIIVIGEVHGVPRHHALELGIIRALHESDVPIVIGMEMFRSESQKDLDAWTSGGMPLHRFISVYYRNWGMGWKLYEDIFLYAREHGIPIAGLNIPDEISDAVARRGFAALTASERKRIPPGVSCTIDESYRRYIRKAYADHAKNDEASFLHFCEAQMVWDKSMAANLVAFMKANPGKKAVVLAGVGHAWRRGIPEQVSLLSRYRTRVVLPLMSQQVDLKSITVEDADYIVLP